MFALEPCSLEGSCPLRGTPGASEGSGQGRARLECVRDGGRVQLRVLSGVRETKLACNATDEGIELVGEGGVRVVEDEVVRVAAPGVLIGHIDLLGEEESLAAGEIVLESVKGLSAVCS
jgi:hypothetical protein